MEPPEPPPPARHEVHVATDHCRMRTRNRSAPTRNTPISLGRMPRTRKNWAGGVPTLLSVCSKPPEEGEPPRGDDAQRAAAWAAVVEVEAGWAAPRPRAGGSKGAAVDVWLDRRIGRAVDGADVTHGATASCTTARRTHAARNNQGEATRHAGNHGAREPTHATHHDWRRRCTANPWPRSRGIRPSWC